MTIAVCIVAYGDYLVEQEYTVRLSEVEANADSWSIVTPASVEGA